MELLAGILIAFSLSAETMGFYLRFAGYESGLPSVGYSLHVQIATLSRIGTFVGLPMIGWLIDTGAGFDSVILVPIVTFGLLVMILSVALLSHSWLADSTLRLFGVLSRALLARKGSNEGAVKDTVSVKMQPSLMRNLLWAGFLSFLFTSSGFFIATLFAALNPDYRATILQLSPAITAIGTLISVVFFDPRISMYIDGNYEIKQIARAIMISRASAAAILLVGCIAIYFYV